MQKVSSAYTKDTDPVDFVKNSLVVYADKKRTTKLLKSIGFSAPIELQQNGYIGRISYPGQNVNIGGEEISLTFPLGFVTICLVVVEGDLTPSSTFFIGLISYRIFSPFAVLAILSVASQTVLFFYVLSFTKHMILTL